MTHKTMRLALMAGAAAALLLTGAASAQTSTAPAPQEKVVRRVVVTNDGQGEDMMFMRAGGGDVDEQVTVGPNGERRVVIIRHGGPGEDEAFGPGGPGDGPGMGHHKMDPAARAQHLRDILQLRPDQEPALQAFITGTAPPEKPPEMIDPEAVSRMTTPERLDWMSARMSEHQAMFQKRADAIKRFYASLSAPQRKAFEAAHIGEMGMGGGGMMIHMRHGGDHGGHGEHGGDHGDHMGPPPEGRDGPPPPPGK